MKFLDDLKFQKNFLIKHKAYLQKGVYVLHENLRTYILKEYMEKDWFPKAESTLKNRIKIFIAHSLFSVRVGKNQNDFSAQAVYFSTIQQAYNRDAKFFDYKGRKVRTVCQNKIRYDLYMRNRKYFEKYFPMVNLLSADEDSLIFEEKLIDKKSIADGQWETVFRKLFDIYSKYYKISEIDKTDSVHRFTHFPVEKNDRNVTLYRQHGDLSSDNFIYDKNGDIFIIDYDHANYYPLYYDLFFLITNLYIWKNNSIGVELLVNGAFDEYIKNANGDDNSVYDAFLLFSDYYLDVCDKDGISYEWQMKYEKIFGDILSRLRKQ